MQIIVALLAISDYLLIHVVWHMRRSGPQPPLKYCIGLVGSRNVQARHAPYGDSPSRRYGVTPRKRRGHNQKSAGMQKTSRSRCSTKSQDGTAERGSALFVVVNAAQRARDS